ncbi:hypothetical protein GGI04_004370 [Coemansia thaxteri]|uniref:2'-phosphotransferase n=1 Tax=Coemansia thaxteri TaxID=2663907 RepID=A0A9W8EH66_9FUNG|nr:hypothetical protein GGI04_004370 [Coemansia thaxteri]KAJ2007395.1 hypothetical protein H4R26_000818 [Coemansia thaxteri]KAJ2470548.1 hypothetical protein GGI02_002854 [Coemansia sp. RSA 2322]KAJ2484360.1 hypothetical protein EV174_002497 [Coemansia sp. RSA 2320]
MSSASKLPAGTNPSGRRPPHGGSKDDSPEVKLSKLLTFLLRHGAERNGLQLRDDGSIAIKDLLAFKKLRQTKFEQIKNVVEMDSKNRYALFEEGENQWYIRAVQGHSINLKQPPLIKLTSETAPASIVHGTMRHKVPLIQETGLNRMERTHIHFATGLPGEDGVISGMRQTANAYIYVDVARAMSDGIEFYTSENGVVLSKGVNDEGVIPAKYFDRIEYKE